MHTRGKEHFFFVFAQNKYGQVLFVGSFQSSNIYIQGKPHCICVMDTHERTKHIYIHPQTHTHYNHRMHSEYIEKTKQIRTFFALRRTYSAGGRFARKRDDLSTCFTWTKAITQSSFAAGTIRAK